MKCTRLGRSETFRKWKNCDDADPGLGLDLLYRLRPGLRRPRAALPQASGATPALHALWSVRCARRSPARPATCILTDCNSVVESCGCASCRRSRPRMLSLELRDVPLPAV